MNCSMNQMEGDKMKNGTVRRVEAIQHAYEMGDIGEAEYVRRLADIFFPINAIGIGGGIIRGVKP